MTVLPWCGAAQSAWSCPVLIFDRTAFVQASGRHFSSRFLPGRLALRLRSSAGGSGPVSPGAIARCVHRSPAGMSTLIRPNGMRATCVQRPTTPLLQPMPSEPVAGPFWRPKSPLPAGRQALLPLPSSGLAECSFADPLGECRRDANSLAPNGPKARTLQSARQELVRVPESNTKYGGLRGITGGKPAPVLEASISESSGIPN